MIKKTIILLMLLTAVSQFAQNKAKGIDVPDLIKKCIKGETVVYLGDTVTYTVDANLAQCENCFDWDISNNNVLSFINPSADQNNSVIYTATGVGEVEIAVTYFDENGCNSCSIIVEVIRKDCQNEYIDNSNGFGNITTNCIGTNSFGNISLNMNAIQNAITNQSGIQYINIEMLDQGIGITNLLFQNNYSNITISSQPYEALFTYRCSTINDSVIQFNIEIVHENGCSTFFGFKHLIGFATSNRQSNISVSPTPSNSTINLTIKNSINKVFTLQFYDLPSGKLITTSNIKNINKDDFKTTLNFPILKNYKHIRLLILENGKKIDSIPIIMK